MTRPTVAPSAQAKRTVSPRKLAHFVLRTPRFREMVEWYTTVLEARVAFASPLLTFLTYDDEHHRVALINQPHLEDADPTAAGVDHVAFTYASLDDLLYTYERLAARGIHPHWCIDHGPTTSMYYRDPDGGQVELQIDNFATDEELQAWFAEGSFAANPIGVEFDPRELLERRPADKTPSERSRDLRRGTGHSSPVHESRRRRSPPS